MKLGRYELGSVLGKGGAGTVYDAVLVGPGDLRKPVALKVLNQGSDALRREARLGGLLRHRHLVDVYEVGEDDGTWFLAMERCDATLVDHLPLPPRAVVEVGLAVCDALSYAHTDLGLVHLDLKPANLLIANGTVKVADLGIARTSVDGGNVPDGIRGTPGYMSPEQASGRDVDARADVYALGVTLAELATGSREAESTLDWLDSASGASTFELEHAVEPTAGPSAVPDWLAPIVQRCTAPTPADRYIDVKALAEALRAVDVDGPGLRVHVGVTAPATPLPSRDSNLGEEPDVFVGREAELAQLAEALEAPGLWTLRGPAGVGKSRLAVTAARAWREAHAGQAWRCDLTDSRSMDDLVSAVATTLDVPLGKGDAVEQLGHALAARGPMVLLLDSFEHLVDARGVVARWRTRAPSARLLVTSRASLALANEQVLDVEVLAEHSARALLIARARARGVDLTNDPDLPALASKLDGLPLALELAAGRLGVLSVRGVLDRLDLQLLRRGTDDRHATLRAALDWSWELLDKIQQAALTQLSTFHGGCTPEAAESVLDLPEGASVLPAVEALVAHSWLGARAGRLRMLESVRTYASGRLVAPHRVEARHGEWVAGLRDALGPRGSVARLRALGAEQSNIVAACERAVARGDHRVALAALGTASEAQALRGASTSTLRLANTVLAAELPPRARAHAERFRALALRDAGRAQEAIQPLEAALALARRVGDAPLEGILLGALGSVESDQGRVAEARQRYVDALAVHLEVGNRRDEGIIRINIGSLHLERGELDQARACFQDALTVHREVGDRSTEAVTLGHLGVVHRVQGRLGEAQACFEAALAAHRELGHTRHEARLVVSMGILHHDQGRMDEARASFEAAIDLHREVGDRRSEGVALGNLGNLNRILNRSEEARQCFDDALGVHREVGNRRDEGIVLGNLGRLHRDGGRFDEARRHYDAALDNARELGNRRFEGWVLLQLSSLAMATDHADAAAAHLDGAEPLFQAVGDVASLTELALLRARVFHQAGAMDAAHEALARAEAIAPEGRPDVHKWIDAVRELLEGPS
jgi:tetratricopeptide (TPR) repeat protein